MTELTSKQNLKSKPIEKNLSILEFDDTVPAVLEPSRITNKIDIPLFYWKKLSH